MHALTDDQKLKSKATHHKLILLTGLHVLRREMLHYGRGRPRGQRRFKPDMTHLLYLFYVSKKYGLDPHKFFECFFDAWTHERSSYKDISIQCRQKTKDDGVFLVTQDQKVITQLRLTGATLKHLPEIDLESPPWNEYATLNKMEKSIPVDMKVKDVNSGVKWVNLRARVVEKPIARTVFSRYGNNPVGVSNSTISDDTGSIKLPLWNNQINMVSVGDTVQIEKGRVRTFRGELQVSVGKSGKLTVIGNQSK
jgi:replication factor A1